MDKGSPNFRFRLQAALAIAVLCTGAPLAAQQVRRTLPGTRKDTTPAAPADSARKSEAVAAKPAVGVIDGLVTDTSLAPLQYARVSIFRTPLAVNTGANGRFRIEDVASGEYILVVRRAGFEPTSQVVRVNPGDTLRLSYVLGTTSVKAGQFTTLAPVVVTEKRQSPRMAEFEARRKLGFGEFMTQDQIEQHNPAFPTELLRLFGTIDVTPTSTGGEEIYYPVSRRATGGMTSTGQAACFMTVYVDNVPMPAPFNLDLLPSPRELAGIEVYAGNATMPIQYATMGSSCGIILVWTKDGFGTAAKP